MVDNHIIKVDGYCIEPISLIVTCYNEEESVTSWCDSFLAMESLPQELIIADSDSTDNTIRKLREGLSGYPGKLVILEGKCNISAGRNKAITAASHKKIAVTDFGVTFHPLWLPKLSDSLDFYDWVGGVYELVWGNSVEKSFCRLFNTPADKLDASSFLPSSRSFGLTRKAFLEVGGYNESLAIGEDTDLVLRLKCSGLTYQLVREALVYWSPRSTIKSIYIQNYRYAYWDGVASQNHGRWNHIAFWIVLLAMPIAGAASFNGRGIVPGLLASIAVLFLKTSRNTRRSCSGLPRPLDMLVYATTILASSIGYISGLFSSKGKLAT